MADYNKRLYRLNNLDKWKVASDDPDVRGWEVRGPDQERIGEVQELIVDPHQEKVRYLDVLVDQDLLTSGDRNELHVLVPVGLASVDNNNNLVKIDEVATETILNTPAYIVEKPIDLEYEEKVVRHLQPEYEHSKDRLYENKALYNEDKFYRRSKQHQQW